MKLFTNTILNADGEIADVRVSMLITLSLYLSFSRLLLWISEMIRKTKNCGIRHAMHDLCLIKKLEVHF
jgi:hypothetical protein